MNKLILPVLSMALFAGTQVPAQDAQSQTATAAGAQGQPQTITGTVSDAMCGKKHLMPGSAADCVHACVKQGSAYALVSGDNVYTLVGHEQELYNYAGQNVTIRGKVANKTVQVDSVSPARS
jgi:hypothetical protein